LIVVLVIVHFIAAKYFAEVCFFDMSIANFLDSISWLVITSDTKTYCKRHLLVPTNVLLFFKGLIIVAHLGRLIDGEPALVSC